MRVLNVGLVVFLSLPGIGVGQDSAHIKGLLPPTAVSATRLAEVSLTRLLNSVKVETDGAVGVPMLKVRVLSAWGQYSGQDWIASRLNCLSRSRQTKRARHFVCLSSLIRQWSLW